MMHDCQNVKAHCRFDFTFRGRPSTNSTLTNRNAISNGSPSSPCLRKAIAQVINDMNSEEIQNNGGNNTSGQQVEEPTNEIFP
jgi:hypothetical protein